MRHLSNQQAYGVLGLAASATSREVHTAFRRLAKRYHPDVCRTTADPRPFVKIVEAYRLLCARLSGKPKYLTDGRCPFCGKLANLSRLLDGRRGCADCLLGRTRLRRMLPGPVRAVARHTPVFLLCGLGIALMARYVRTEDLTAALLALGSVWLGFGILTAQVLTIAFHATRPSRLRPAPFEPYAHPREKLVA